MIPISQMLLSAGADAQEAEVYNASRAPAFRFSRCGLPLIASVFEDMIEPALPKLVVMKQENAQRTVSSRMNLAIGYVFESAVVDYLKASLPEYTVTPQVALSWEDINGTCDILAVNHELKSAIVVECKALNVSTLKEAVSRKLEVDNWGYLSQLAAYVAAAKRLYPEFTVFGKWYVWAKAGNSMFIHPLKPELAQIAQDDIKLRLTYYTNFQQAFAAKDIDGCMQVVLASLEAGDEIPEKEPYYNGFAASCGLHYNKWAKAFLDSDGFLCDNWETRFRTLLACSLKLLPPDNALSLLTGDE